MIFFPVIFLVCGIPLQSRRYIPICEGTNPFLANWHIKGVIFSNVELDHFGDDLLNGNVVVEIPFLLYKFSFQKYVEYIFPHRYLLFSMHYLNLTGYNKLNK